MQEVLQYIEWGIGLPLELLIISALVRGPFRRFPFLLLYSVALFLTTVIEISINQAYFAGIRFAYSPATYYWVDEGVRQTLLLATVLSLAYLATGSLRSRTLLRIVLISGGVAVAATSFLVHHQNHLAAGIGRWRWMTLWVRDMDFTAAIVDLAICTLLLASRQKDTQVLLISGGLGIQFTGEAMGESLRYLFPQWSSATGPGTIIVVATSLAAFWVLWRALRPVPLPRRAELVFPPRNGTGI